MKRTKLKETLCKFSGKRVAVTGAGGFVGSHLVKLLLKEGAVVTVLDVVEPSARLGDVSSRFDYINFDLLDRNKAILAIAQAEPQIVFHLAAYAVQSRDRDIQTAIRINVDGSAIVAEGSALSGAEKLIQIGTSHEYGGSQVPIGEDFSLNPAGIYGATKASGMIVGRAIAKEKGIPWLGLRPFVTYGPGEDSDKLVPYIIESGLSGKPVVTTAGTQVRDFTFVSDLVEGVLAAAAVHTSDATILNIASGKGTRLRELFETLQGLLPDADFQIGGRENRRDDVEEQIADIAKRQRLIPFWEPKTSLKDGLEKTIAYYGKKLSLLKSQN